MAHVVVGTHEHVADSQRRTRLSPLQRLALGCFVATQRQWAVRPIQVKTNHVPELGREVLVARYLLGAHLVQLDVVGASLPLHRHWRYAAAAGHRAHAPAAAPSGPKHDFQSTHVPSPGLPPIVRVLGPWHPYARPGRPVENASPKSQTQVEWPFAPALSFPESCPGRAAARCALAELSLRQGCGTHDLRRFSFLPFVRLRLRDRPRHGRALPAATPQGTQDT